jgi:hypothetical protein
MKIQDIQNIPAHIINLDRHPELLESSKKELEKMGLRDIRRAKAIDGKLQESYVEERLRQLGCPITNFKNYGYAALGITILDMLQEFLAGTDEYIWTFEDDIILHSNFHEEFDKLHELRLEDFDMCYFGAAILGGDSAVVAEQTKNARQAGKAWVTISASIWQFHAVLWNRVAAGAYVEFAQNMMVTDYYMPVLVPNKLMALKRPPLRRICLIADRNTASNRELLKHIVGKYETCGLIYQRTGIPVGIPWSQRTSS